MAFVTVVVLSDLLTDFFLLLRGKSNGLFRDGLRSLALHGLLPILLLNFTGDSLLVFFGENITSSGMATAARAFWQRANADWSLWSLLVKSVLSLLVKLLLGLLAI